MQDLRALSVRQPWAYAITRLGKDIENRSRSLGYRGLVLIHASKGMTPDEFRAADDFILSGPRKQLPPVSQLDRGGIVGVAEITECLAFSSSPWWMGPWGLKLANARPVPFIECPGTVAPLFWRPSGEVLEQLRPHL